MNPPLVIGWPCYHRTAWEERDDLAYFWSPSRNGLITRLLHDAVLVDDARNVIPMRRRP